MRFPSESKIMMNIPMVGISIGLSISLPPSASTFFIDSSRFFTEMTTCGAVEPDVCVSW